MRRIRRWLGVTRESRSVNKEKVGEGELNKTSALGNSPQRRALLPVCVGPYFALPAARPLRPDWTQRALLLGSVGDWHGAVHAE